MPNEARDEVALRLDKAIADLNGMGERHRAAIGTAGEFSAYAQLRAAAEDVDELKARLKSLDYDADGGRMWVNGLEVGGPNSRFLGLDESHD